MRIKYKVIIQYGHKRMFIINPHKREAFEAITGRKCVTLEDLDNFKLFGVTFIDENEGEDPNNLPKVTPPPYMRPSTE